MEGNFLNSIKDVYKNSAANLTLNGESLNAFPWGLTMSQGPNKPITKSAKDTETHLTKGDVRMANKCIRNVPHHWPSGKRKVRPRGKMSPLLWHTIRTDKVKILTAPNADRAAEQVGLADTAGRMSNGTDTLETGHFLKKKKSTHTLIIQFSDPTPGHSSQRHENLCPHKNLYTIVHTFPSLVIINNWKWPKCPAQVNGEHRSTRPSTSAPWNTSPQ